MTLSAYNPSTKTFSENDATKPLDSDDLVTAIADSRAIAVPAAPGQLLGGSGTAGAAVAITLGTGFSLASNTLSYSGGGASYTFSTGLTNTAGTITVDFGGLGSAPTVAHSDHTHTIYAQTANNLSDVANVGTARTNLGLGNIATLAGTVQGQINYYNGAAWTVLAPGTAGQVLTTGGAAANPSWTTVSGGAGSGTINSGTTNQLAYYAANGTAVSGLTFNSADFSISAGTISIQGTATHGLSAGPGLAAGDEVAVWSLAANSGAGGDVKYNLPQIGAFFLSNWQSWATAGRPTLATGQRATGYNTDLARFEFGSNTGGTTTWNQHTRVSDMVATSAQLFGGTGTNGVAQAIDLGSGLTLTGTTLSSSGGGAVLNSRPALSSLTWLNQGTTTANEITGGPIVLTFPAAGAGAAIGLEQVAPAAPYTFTARNTFNYPFNDTGMTAGLFIRNSSTGSFSSVTQDYAKTSPNQGVGVYRYTGSGATFSSTLRGMANTPGRIEYLRVINDGTNITYLCSADGYAWITMYSETVATAGSPNRLGQYSIPFDGATLNIAALLTIREWSILSSASPQAPALTAGV